MHTLRRRRTVTLLVLCVLALRGSTTAHSANRHDSYPLHGGSAGPNVAAAQWLESGHRPNVFTQVKPTLKKHGYTKGVYGARTKAGTEAYEYRLGFPAKGQCGATHNLYSPNATRQLYLLLVGKAKRPACWIALAASRVHAVNPTPHPSTLGSRWAALLGDWLGISEQPNGSNAGPCISRACTRDGLTFAIQSSTGAYDAAWCVSTQQEAAELVGFGHFADDTAGVYYAVDYYAARNLVFAKPKLYAIVAFIDYDPHGIRIPGTGHMGFVTAVYANSFTYRAGNDGNAVSEHTIQDGSRSYAFIYLSGVA